MHANGSAPFLEQVEIDGESVKSDNNNKDGSMDEVPHQSATSTKIALGKVQYDHLIFKVDEKEKKLEQILSINNVFSLFCQNDTGILWSPNSPTYIPIYLLNL